MSQTKARRSTRGSKRTQMIGQILRQHRNDAIGEIHRRGASARLQVQLAAEAHVIADIGNGDDDPPAAAALRLGIHGIVEILGVGAVDGHQRRVAQVLAALPVGRLHFRRKAIGRSGHFGRKRLRQVMPQDREARRKVGGPQIVQHVDDAPLRRRFALRPPGHLDDDVVAVARAVPLAAAHLHRVPMAGILRLHPAWLSPAPACQTPPM
jgi:hypothetical protein